MKAHDRCVIFSLNGLEKSLVVRATHFNWRSLASALAGEVDADLKIVNHWEVGGSIGLRLGRTGLQEKLRKLFADTLTTKEATVANPLKEAPVAKPKKINYLKLTVETDKGNKQLLVRGRRGAALAEDQILVAARVVDAGCRIVNLGHVNVPEGSSFPPGIRALSMVNESELTEYLKVQFMDKQVLPVQDLRTWASMGLSSTMLSPKTTAAEVTIEDEGEIFEEPLELDVRPLTNPAGPYVFQGDDAKVTWPAGALVNQLCGHLGAAVKAMAPYVMGALTVAGGAVVAVSAINTGDEWAGIAAPVAFFAAQVLTAGVIGRQKKQHADSKWLTEWYTTVAVEKAGK